MKVVKMMKIKEMPLECRPRELLKKNKKKNLSNEELLAILIGSGTKNISVKELSLEVLKLIDTINMADKLTLSQLKNIKGIGQAKAMSIIAAVELGKRIYILKNQNITKINNGQDIYNLFSYLYKLEKQENLIVVLLDNKNCIIDSKIIFKGTINMSIAHPREIFRYAILSSAFCIIIVHNHPSGTSYPSQNDILFTSKIIETGKIVGIPVIDHIIIGNNNYYTFRDNKVVKINEE